MKKLIVERTEFIYHALGFDGNSEAVSLAEWFVNTLVNNGKVEVSVEKTFNEQENIPIYMIEFEDEDLEERMEEEFDGELPLKFEFEGVNYELELG